ncbi:uncharacterized protein LOC131013520 [Salvia miltiorrhiza]|uniref:uncharacterized protein LOC131013520 n=1 Tax=Salvia miltiorrhiza TaxID=226208 RepID=UPI0025AC12FC|nr:uncharacterized protein LOC131013520 [Salvia miltiorrhiza]
MLTRVTSFFYTLDRNIPHFLKIKIHIFTFFFFLLDNISYHGIHDNTPPFHISLSPRIKFGEFLSEELDILPAIQGRVLAVPDHQYLVNFSTIPLDDPFLQNSRWLYHKNSILVRYKKCGSGFSARTECELQERYMEHQVDLSTRGQLQTVLPEVH